MSALPTLTAEIAFTAKPGDQIRRGITLDGSDDFVSVPDHSALRVSTAFTIEAWIKPTARSQETIVCKGNAAADPDYLFQVSRTGTDNGISLYNGTSWHDGSANTIVANKWQHVAVTFGGTTCSFYVDGNPAGTATITAAAQTSTDTLRFGQQGSTNSNNFTGSIDEIRIWGVVKTQAEIQASMGVELTGSESNLVGYWKFNEGSGTSVNDETSNNNDGTLTNGPTWFNDWTDVSSYLLPVISTKRGRQRELDKFNPGEFSVVLDNTDRRFDPTNTSSPYHPNVVPNKRIRIKATHPTTSVEYPVIDGYVDSWPPAWQVSNAWVTVTATDAQKMLAKVQLEHPYVQEVLNDSPGSYYRFNQTSDQTPVVLIDSSGNDRYGTLYNPKADTGTQATSTFNGYELGQPDPITDGVDGAVMFWHQDQNAATSRAYGLIYGAPTGTADASYEWWFWRESLAVHGTQTIIARTSSPDAEQTSEYLIIQNRLIEGGPNDGKLQIHVQEVTGGSTIVFQKFMATEQFWHRNNFIHCVLTNQGTVWTLYINGVQTDTGTGTGNANFPDDRLLLGSYYASGRPTAQHFAGALDEVAIYSGVLSVSRILAHYNARNAWLNDQTGARINKVLDQAGWPAADRSIDTGQSQLQSAPDLDRAKAMDHLMAVADSEFGALYITKDGKVRFRERHAILKAPYTTSQATFADDGTGFMYANPVFEYSDLQIKNDVSVDRNNGQPQRVEDQTSIDTYGRQSESISGLLNNNDKEILDLAHWVLQHYKDPHLQITQLVLEPHAEDTDGTFWTKVLGFELEDRVTVKATPPGGGPVINKEVHIQGISHQIGPGPRWVTTLDLSPADIQSYWVLGTSALGTDTKLAA